MKVLSSGAYRSLFLKHVTNFLESVTSNQEMKGTHVIAVSGGRDSMALLWVAFTLKSRGIIGNVRAVFIHHHTRTGQDLDQKLVENYCNELGISLAIHHAQGLLDQDGNFEARARVTRRKLLLDATTQGESLWLGHHLDDSYEWAIMQRNRSSRIRSTLGIPVRNGKIIRPFLCVSRKQIERIVRIESIPFRDDPTNLDLHYDRNFVRHEVVANIRKRFPKYLKHYVSISNQAAVNMSSSVLRLSALVDLYSYENGSVLIGQKFDVIQIQELIHNYSNTDRGELVAPIGRMLMAIRNGKKGPFQFSGGVDAYYNHNLLTIYQRNVINSDEEIAKTLDSLSNMTLEKIASFSQEELATSFQNLLNDPEAIEEMPGLILVMENKNICKTLSTSVFDARFPKVSQLCQKRGLRFTSYTKCLERWKTQQKNLPEKLKIIPLHNLAHLFPSQA